MGRTATHLKEQYSPLPFVIPSHICKKNSQETKNPQKHGAMCFCIEILADSASLLFPSPWLCAEPGVPAVVVCLSRCPKVQLTCYRMPGLQALGRKRDAPPLLLGTDRPPNPEQSRPTGPGRLRESLPPPTSGPGASPTE